MSGTTKDGRSVTGTFTPKRFKVAHDRMHGRHLVVTGMLRGAIQGNGKSRAFHRMVSMPVQDVQAGSTMSGGRFAASQGAGCNVLNLDLGPLDLNLLGLQVHLDEVVLDITAVPGAGNLLGNLLCDVAGLLDNTGGGGLGGLLNGLLTQLTGLLNQILGQLP